MGIDLIKKPHVRTSLTQEQMKSFLRCEYDPLYFMNTYMKVQYPVIGVLPFTAYPFQERFIDIMHNNRLSIGMLSRQSGKTTCTAGYLLWYAMFNPDVTVLIAANKFKAASEIMSRVKFAYEEMPNFIKSGVLEYNTQSVKFDNKSRIMAYTTTPDTGRGMSLSLLYCDEFAFIRPKVAEEFWTAMSPTLATGGKCIITSTPNSDEDKFAEIWNGATNTIDEWGNPIPGGLGRNGFKSFTALYSEVPGRDEEWAQKEINKITLDRFRREYQCEFITADETLIAPAKLAKLKSRKPEFTTHQHVRWYQSVEKGKTYLLALDPSAGVRKDDSVIQVFMLPDMIQIAEWSNNNTSPKKQTQMLKDLVNYIHDELKTLDPKSEPDIYYTFENNSVGEAIIVSLHEIGENTINGQLINEPGLKTTKKRKGLNTNTRTKVQSCTRLKTLIETDRMTLNSELIVRQLKFYVSKGDSFGGKTGEHDDAVSATLLCVRLMQIATSWDESIASIFRDDEEESFREPLPFSFMRL